MSKLLIKNIELLHTTNGQMQCIAVENDKITYVGIDTPADMEGAEIIDGKGKLATAGMVNTHGHVSMTLLRSYADDMALMDWLENQIWPIEAKMNANDIYWGAMLGIVEMLKSGTTCFADMYAFMEDVARACAETGIRANLCRGLIGVAPDKDVKLAENNTLAENWQGYDNGRIRVTYGPHAPYTCPVPYLEKVIEAAAEHKAEIQMHLCETKFEVESCVKEHGVTPIKLMDSLGMFELGTIAAHCVHLTDEDMDIMAAKKVRVAHNPQSNLKLASGIAPVAAMLQKGICVGLGTDGASSNNNLDMLEECRAAAMLHKATTFDPLAVPASKAWAMATEDGAKTLGFAQLGRLEAGQLADIVLWDMHKPYWYPRHNKLSQLVYAANSSDVDTVIVAGKKVVEQGRLLTFDEEKIYAEAEACAQRLINK
ncbi:amidohydrolase [uncultured Phascolarctobacterium sp.]|uniref:amidohydrolase n=1 Tax=uncultured Phascolarctobacterium sp. TaxID=512296 RepID=UPI0025FBEC3B|nr:amidohydrolase [uncultured Phascolarctobacterium sp.]